MYSEEETEPQGVGQLEEWRGPSMAPSSMDCASEAKASGYCWDFQGSSSHCIPRNCLSLTVTLYLGSRLWGHLPWGHHHNTTKNEIS